MIDGLKWVKERGRKLGVIGTPNFFIQGKLVKKHADDEGHTRPGRAVPRRFRDGIGGLATAAVAGSP